jgi:hypothetical protein
VILEWGICFLVYWPKRVFILLLFYQLLPAREAKERLLVNVIVGIDQQGTSREALEELLNWNVNCFVFHQNEKAIFHPKIYLFEGLHESVVIVGSSNLTVGGLFSNVESSIMLETQNEEEAAELIETLKAYFKGIFDFSDPNLLPLTSAIIEDLVKLEKVPQEVDRTQQHNIKRVNQEIKELAERLFPKRSVLRPPLAFIRKSVRKKSRTNQEIVILSETREDFEGTLVWQRRKLPASSVQKSKTGTNLTGGLRLVQDDFEIEGQKIDQTTYFRQVLFVDYEWKTIKQSPVVEVAKVPIKIYIFDEDFGTHLLEIRHKPSGEASQGNYTTSLSWGEMGQTVRDKDLEGRRLSLYQTSEKDLFCIVID